MALVTDQDIEILLYTYDRDKPILEKLDRYHQGNHDSPYVPRHANEEYRRVSNRCYTNFIRQAVAIPTQTLFVDGFRAAQGGAERPSDIAEGSEWEAWQRSRMDMIQSAIYSGAFVFGYALVEAYRDPKTKRVKMRGISALKSSAIFDDPANDISPRAAIEVLSEPVEVPQSNGHTAVTPGQAYVWGETHKEMIEIGIKNPGTGSKAKTFRRIWSARHGAKECPITRFAASMDLEGRCVGIVEPLIQLQDRINQSVLDLLVAQLYTAFQVRTATGMSGVVKQRPIFEKDEAGNIIYDEDTGQPVVLEFVDVIDSNGQPVMANPQLNAATMLISEEPDAKFGVLPGAPLDGFIDSINMSVKHFATLSATPPHYMMGSITNISADALQAAEMALKRKIDLFKIMFGECWERAINVAMQFEGYEYDDIQLETLWRDMEGQSFARMADALLKLKELNVPAEGLWTRIPGITANELREWKELIDEDPDQILAAAVNKGLQASPNGTSPTAPNREMTNADPDLE